MDLNKVSMALGAVRKVGELVKAIEHLELDSVLSVVGLETRPGAGSRLLPALGLITLSAAVGAGTALLLAPSSGTRLRARLSDGLEELKHQLSDTISQLDVSPSHNARHIS